MIQDPVKRRRAQVRINRFGKHKIPDIRVQERDTVTEARDQMDRSFG
jgi:hypothetical protein